MSDSLSSMLRGGGFIPGDANATDITDLLLQLLFKKISSLTYVSAGSNGCDKDQIV